MSKHSESISLWYVIQMLSHKTLVMLLGMDPSQNPDQPLPAHHPQVTFAYTKHLWMSDRREEAYRYVPVISILSGKRWGEMLGNIIPVYNNTLMKV